PTGRRVVFRGGVLFLRSADRRGPGGDGLAPPMHAVRGEAAAHRGTDGGPLGHLRRSWADVSRVRKAIARARRLLLALPAAGQPMSAPQEINFVTDEQVE